MSGNSISVSAADVPGYYGCSLCGQSFPIGISHVCYAARPSVATPPDMVNHPPHYTAGGIECIDALRAALGLR